MARHGELTPKQRLFIHEYMIDLNATQAAIRAGYSKKTAEVIGNQLLKKTLVFNELQKKQRKIINKLEITVERVLSEYARIAFSDMRKFVKWGADGVRLHNSDGLEDDDALCVSEVSETITKDGGSVKFKLHDKVSALKDLALHLGLLKEKPPPFDPQKTYEFVLRRVVKEEDNADIGGLGESNQGSTKIS